MFSNKQISKILKLWVQLLELHHADEFKIKTLSNAVFKIGQLPYLLAEKSLEEISQIQGIGKSTAQKIEEIINTGTAQELQQLLSKTPTNTLDLLKIKGLGAKKVLSIQEQGIESVGDLHYACIENRLISLKGFGAKSQEEIKKNIEFLYANAGKSLYASLVPIVGQIEESIGTKWKQRGELFSVSGEYRRKCEIIEKLQFLLTDSTPNEFGEILLKSDFFEDIKIKDYGFDAKSIWGLSIAFYIVPQKAFYWELFEQTGSSQYVNTIKRQLNSYGEFDSEEAIYQTIKMPYLAPVLRENAIGEPPLSLINLEHLKGTLHNHSLWSDGANSLKEMALYCRDILNLEYLGISDHSKAAFYANGLTEERILAQHQEIDVINRQLAPFRIFKGIEADILANGELDYTDDVLQSFDFVIASIHSNLKMDESKAMQRLIKAIENPYTTILGHPTGRLLLNRAGYPIDYKKVIDACADNEVIIEINANPMRLDLDWRWYSYAVQKGVLLSINPDAHNLQGLHDMEYGIIIAQKGGLVKENVFNTFTLAQIGDYLTQRKRQKGIFRHSS